MRLVTLFVLALAVSTPSSSQLLTIRNEKNFGGSLTEFQPRMLRLPNGELMLCGASGSKNGDLPKHSVAQGAFLMKLDQHKNVLWSKVYGTPYEIIGETRFAQTPDGGFIIMGTNSACSRNTPTYPTRLLWFLKVNSTGDVEWERCSGGNSHFEPGGIVATNNGYLVTAFASGSNGWMEGAKGRGDIFIAWLDLQGNLAWRKMFGGSQYEESLSAIQTSDGNFLVAGNTSSIDGDITSNTLPYQTAFLCKINQAGNVLWQKTYGPHTIRIFEMLEDKDGSIYVAGEGTRDTGVYHYKRDGWIAKLDVQGNILWNKFTGGTKGERLHCIAKNDRNEIAAGGYLGSFDDEVSGNINQHTMWVVKYNEATGKISHGFFGGENNTHFVADIHIDNQGDITFSSSSPTDNPYMSQPKGGSDAWLVTLGAANKITGKVFLDADSNSSQQPGEQYFNGGKVMLTAAHRPGWDHKVVPGPNGQYSFTTDTGTYTVRFVPDYPYYSSRPPTYTTAHSSYQNNDTADFGVVVTQQVADLAATIVPLTQVRPGFPVSYLLTWRNQGTLPAHNTLLQLSLDPKTTFVAADNNSFTTTDNQLTWALGTTAPFDSGSIKITLVAAPPPALNINDTVRIVAQILPDENDITKEDNRATLQQIAIGSFDPNDKSEQHAGTLTDDAYQRKEYLYYTIRFQNTGNDTAYTVRITDTLDENVDPATLQMVSASHQQTLSIINNRFLSWQFDNIRLVDSNKNEPLSHGFVCFRVKPRSGLPAGTTLQNKAFIYFDFNLPVETNTVTTMLLEKPLKPPPGTDTIPVDTIPTNPGNNFAGTGLIDPEYPGATIYHFPNPARELVTLAGLQASKTYNIVVTTGFGQVCFIKTISSLSTATMYTGFLSKGLYFLQLIDVTRQKNLGVLKVVVK